MHNYYFIFEYTEESTGIDKKSSHVASALDYFTFNDILKKCSNKYRRRWIVTFFAEISQEEYDDYVSYVDSI